jgi:hypothetical protein
MKVMEKLYLVHCGFYDPELAGGNFESHVNHFVVATNVEGAKFKAKELDAYKSYRMHIDGILEVNAVGGYRISAERDLALHTSQSENLSHRHRELATNGKVI